MGSKMSEIRQRDFSCFKDAFEGYSREWIRKAWNACSYLGFDFSFEDLHTKVEGIERKNASLNGFGKFWMKEGFLEKFLKLKDFRVILNPDPEVLQNDFDRYNLIVLLDSSSQLFQKIKQEVPEQCRDRDIFLLYNEHKDDSKIVMFLATKDLVQSQKLFEFLNEGKGLLVSHEIWKGWPLCTSGRYMVTSLPRHPAKILSDALRMNCRWAFFVGPGEDLSVKELMPKLNGLGLDFTVLSGQFTGDGKCLMVDWNKYPDPQSSDMSDAFRMKSSQGGLLFGVFGSVWDPDTDILKDDVDGYAFHEGNSEFLEETGSPFLVIPYYMEWGDLPPSMWLFIDRKHSGPSSKERVMRAIQLRKAAGVFSDGKVVGSLTIVNLIKMLLADKEYLRKTFWTCFSLTSELDGTTLNISMENKLNEPLDGVLEVKASPGIRINGSSKLTIHLNGGEKRTISLETAITDELSGSYGLFLIEFFSNDNLRRNLCYIEVPPPVTTFPILISEGQLEVPVTVWNNNAEIIEIRLNVFSQGRRILEEKKSIQVTPYRMHKTAFPVSLGAGEYELEFSCLISKATCRLLVHDFEGKAMAFMEDYDGDGLKEAILENDLVMAKVISPGGRLLQYMLKNVGTDLLFKLYPKRPDDWRVPDRKRRFYPFGGLEEFIQQPTVEGHEEFEIRIVREEGSSAIVSAMADMYGNVLKKTFKLFGGSPLLEVGYEADFINPELNVIGINPLIKLGNDVDANHVIYYPSNEGMLEERYRGRLYGKRLFLKGNWIACYDEQEKLGLIMAYDTRTPFLTHLWMNTPENPDSHYSYIEIQPWIKINTGTTTYFSYYLYGFKGSFDEALKRLKKLFPLG